MEKEIHEIRGALKFAERTLEDARLEIQRLRARVAVLESKPEPKIEYGFWGYGPTGKIHMVPLSANNRTHEMHLFVCEQVDASDEAHYGDGSWFNIGRGSCGRKVESVLNTEEDVLKAMSKPRRKS